MNARERVIRTIEFGRPDRLPLQFSNDPDFSDLIGVAYARADGWKPPMLESVGRAPDAGALSRAAILKASRAGLDEWGCFWQEHEFTSWGQVRGHPLADWSALDSYVFPNPDVAGRFAESSARVAHYQDRYLVGSIGIMGLNRLFFLRGFENLMVDLLVDLDRISPLADKVFAFMTGVASHWADVGVQGVSVADDLGSEQGVMISPFLFRSFFKPRYAAYCAHCHRLGLHTILHSCGNVWDIIPDLIEVGFDVLNLEQPRVFGLERLGATFAGKVCFLTNPDSQTVIPVATPAEVAAETRLVVKTLATDAGGIIGNADCSWNHGYTPQANLDAMREAFLDMSSRPWGAW
jgi:uroporphyrinogen decarboxylase